MDLNGRSCHQTARMFECGLIVGGVNDMTSILRLQPHAVYALDIAPYRALAQRGYTGYARLWEIPDGGVLPPRELAALVENIAARLEKGERVGLACIGGHGRTGYVAACVLGRMGADDPVRLLKRRYCPQVIETEEQAREVRRYLAALRRDTPPERCWARGEYDVPGVWKNGTLEDRMGEPTEDSVFVLNYSRQSGDGGVAWFNSPRKAAGYMKYVLLERLAVNAVICELIGQIAEAEPGVTQSGKRVAERNAGSMPLFAAVNRALAVPEGDCFAALCAAADGCAAQTDGRLCCRVVRGAGALRAIRTEDGDFRGCGERIGEILTRIAAGRQPDGRTSL